MGKASQHAIVDQARRFIVLFDNSSDAEFAHHGDDLLSYLRVLHDNFEIASSRSPRFSGKTFVLLDDLIYDLGTDPSATLQNASSRELIRVVLDDLVTGRISISPRSTTSNTGT